MLLPHIPGPSVHTFLEVVATSSSSGRSSLLNLIAEHTCRPFEHVPNTPSVHKERSLRSSNQAKTIAAALNLYPYSILIARHACCPCEQVPNPEHLFPFTRNVPCGRRNQAKTSSCSSGFISLFNFNSEAHMLLPHIPGPSAHTFLEVVATSSSSGRSSLFNLIAKHTCRPFEQVPNTSFRSQGTFLAVVATKRKL